MGGEVCVSGRVEEGEEKGGEGGGEGSEGKRKGRLWLRR